jgi:hypothetical protein
VTIRGIELAEKIKKDQFNLRPLTGKTATAPEMWARVLAARTLENYSPDKNIDLIKFAPEPSTRRWDVYGIIVVMKNRFIWAHSYLRSLRFTV